MNRSDTLHPEVAIPESVRTTVVTLGLDEMFPLEQGHFSARDATSADELLNIVKHEEVATLVLGPRLKASTVRAILLQISSRPRSPLAIVMGLANETNLLQEFVDDGRVFYISRGALTPAQLRALVTAAIGSYELRLGRECQNPISSESRIDGSLEYCIRLLNQTDPAHFSALLVEAVTKVVGADRAHCLFCNTEEETLSSLDRTTREERIESAASGLAAFVARTGVRVDLQRVGADPRYDPEADNPDGTPGDRFVAAPVLGVRGPIAVVIAIRSEDAAAFSSDDTRILEFLLDCAHAPLSLILLNKRLDHLLVKETRATDVFRREALDHHTGMQDAEGALVQTSPSWLKRAHWLSVALLAASLAFLVVARVKEKAVGPAIVRARSKITLAAPTGGLVRSVEVSAGDHVRRGDLLVRFQDQRDASGVDQFREQLRASDDGVVEDVQVRAGQQVAAGDPIASIVDEDAGYELIVLLPGQYAPQMRRGMQGAFTVDGYPDSHAVVTIDNVGSEVVGPREAARYAGAADAITVTGPVVVFSCLLKSASFSAGNVSYVYRDGMTARAEVDLRSEPMIVNLLPGLKEFVRNLK